MYCPTCGEKLSCNTTRTVSTNGIRRWRSCSNGHKFVTIEFIESTNGMSKITQSTNGMSKITQSTNGMSKICQNSRIPLVDDTKVTIPLVDDTGVSNPLMGCSLPVLDEQSPLIGCSTPSPTSHYGKGVATIPNFDGPPPVTAHDCGGLAADGQQFFLEDEEYTMDFDPADFK